MARKKMASFNEEDWSKYFTRVFKRMDKQGRSLASHGKYQRKVEADPRGGKAKREALWHAWMRYTKQ